MRAEPGNMQTKRLYAEQLVDSIVEVTLIKLKLEEVRRNPARRAESEAQLMSRYSHAREIAVILVVAEEAGSILFFRAPNFRKD